MLKVSGKVSIPLREIEFKAIRSQGAGGQAVNKVSAAMQLFFDIPASSLPAAVKERLLALGDQRISQDGVVIIKAQESRSQEANREAALERFRELVRCCATAPKKRRATRPTKGSQDRRIKSKVLRGKTKSLRGTPRRDS